MSIPDRSRPVLVTGGSGFAGSYTVRALHDAGYDVVVCDLNDYQPESRFVIGGAAEQIPVERGSIDNWPRVLDVVNRYRPGAIVHLASIMDLPFLDQNPMVALKVNVEGTVNLLEAARFNDVQRFVFFSTIGVIPQVKYEPIDAAHPVVLPRHGPRGAYSVAKLCGEGFCFAYEQSFGLDVRVIRPSALYGFGMSALAPNYMKQIVEPAVRGEPVRLPTGGPVPRDYVHVLDVASLVAAVLEGADDADRIYYGATGEPLRTGGDVGSITRGSSRAQRSRSETSSRRAIEPSKGVAARSRSRTPRGSLAGRRSTALFAMAWPSTSSDIAPSSRPLKAVTDELGTEWSGDANADSGCRWPTDRTGAHGSKPHARSGSGRAWLR